MRRRFLLALFGCALIAAGAISAAAQTKMPQLKFRERTLPNGLRVLSVVDKSSPTVAINVWYHVGSKDDPDQRSGFAHLFEHLMFKSTKNMKAEMMDRLTEDVGEIITPTPQTTLRSITKLCRRTIWRLSCGQRPIVFQA